MRIAALLAAEWQATRRLRNDPLMVVMLALIVLSLAVFVLYPLYKVLMISITTEKGLSLESYQYLWSTNTFRVAYINTLKISLLAALTATTVGFAFAYTFAYTAVPFKPLFRVVAVLPMVSPPFVIALSTILLFGRMGFITSGLLGLENFNIYGLHGLLFVETLAYFPVAFLALVGVLQAIDPSLEEAALNSGASRWAVFRSITLPVAMPGVANALLVAFIQSLADFGNPMIIGGKFYTLPVQIYLQAIGSYDLRGGASLAVVLLVNSLVFFLIQRYWIGRKAYVTVSGRASRERTLITSKWVCTPLLVLCSATTLIVFLLYALVPVGAFIRTWGVDYSFTLNNFRYVFLVGSKAVMDTTKLALIAGPIAGLLGMVIAFLVVRKRFLGRGAVEFISMLGMAVPGTVLGIGYIVAFNGKPLVLTGTAIILLAVFVFRYMPVGLRAGISTLKQIDPSIEEASANLGASSQRTFFKVVLPLISPAFFTGLIYAFVRSMTALSAIIFLVSAKYNLITSSLLNQVDGGRYGAASAFATVLLIIVVTFVVGVNLLIKRLGMRTGALEF